MMPANYYGYAMIAQRNENTVSNLRDRLLALSHEAAALAALVDASDPGPVTDITIGDITYDPAFGLFRNGNSLTYLTRCEMQLMTVLIARRGVIATSDELAAAIGQSDSYTRTISMHIAHIRKKAGAEIITTVPGRGYRLKASEGVQ
jgi:DNA-binding response OmpR family regulator